MNGPLFKSEIRDSIVRELIEKVRKQNYGSYLLSVRLEKIRFFKGARINFDFPVTALIGPNGGGKSTVLGASACIYATFTPATIFRKSRVGDESMDDWQIEYEVIDKTVNQTGSIRATAFLKENSWTRSYRLKRDVRLLGILRTLPTSENPVFMLKKKLTFTGMPLKTDVSISATKVENIDHIKTEAQRVLGKSLADFQLLEITCTTTKKRFKKSEITGREVMPDGTVRTLRRKLIPPIFKGTSTHKQKQWMYLGNSSGTCYSEFNFGSGEASVIRMIADIESQRDCSMVLIEEIENGLHPLAVHRMVEYLMDVAKRKSLQIVFTTHSDYALAPLPSEAIWCSMDGRLQQGKLSVAAVRAISGRVDTRLAIFVEDDFAKTWVEAVARERTSENLEEIAVHAVYGDGNAVKTHLAHMSNPSISFQSLCFIDGDSKQKEDFDKGIFRLPGSMPELTIFDSVLKNLDTNIGLLTVACQRPPGKQGVVADAIREVSHTNRDPHLLFSQIGMKLGFLAEATIKGAFLAVWMEENRNGVDTIAGPIEKALQSPAKSFH
jgi:AAA15 family ATPase/GTPase